MSSTSLTDVLDLSLTELSLAVCRLREQPYRARQIQEWIYRKGILSFDKMTNLSMALREKLSRQLYIGGAAVERRLREKDSGTVKYRFRLADDSVIEAVSMPEEEHRTACVSCQVGCAMGCVFCATAAMAGRRNLTCGEILIQLLEITRREGKVTNVVFMGMGEPLLNLPNVLKAIDAITDPDQFGLGARRVTLSTCGILPGIDELAQSAVPVRLALSLNSPFQKQRAELMPIAKKHPLPDVLDACARYAKSTGQRVTIEYVLLSDVNTGRKAATALAKISAQLKAKVNLIQYNPVDGLPFASPDTKETTQFREWLENEGVGVTVRFRKGRDIKAACGQLAGE